MLYMETVVKYGPLEVLWHRALWVQQPLLVLFAQMYTKGSQLTREQIHPYRRTCFTSLGWIIPLYQGRLALHNSLDIIHVTVHTHMQCLHTLTLSSDFSKQVHAHPTLIY